MDNEIRRRVHTFRTSGSTAPDVSLLTTGEWAISTDNDAPKAWFLKNDGTLAEFVDVKLIEALISENEEVIAAALNDLNSRINDVEANMPQIVNSTGDSTTDVMSQKAVTDAIASIIEPINELLESVLYNF